MKVRTPNEIKSLDDDLKLFDEEAWKFLGVVDNHEQNYEYFNDIQDVDFKIQTRRQKIIDMMPFITLICVVITCCVIAVSFSGTLDFTDYNKFKSSLTGQNHVSTMQYVSGADVTDACLSDVNKVLQGYVNVLKIANKYDDLYNYCVTTSTFADSYNSYTSRISSLMDENDCEARMLRKIGSYCSVSRINKIIEHNGQYYCYVSIYLPSEQDMYEYIMMHQKPITQEFNGGTFTQGDVIQFLLKLIDEMSVPCTSDEYCIKFVKDKDNNYKIVDDSVITSSCLNTYSSALQQLYTILGEKLGNKIGS